MCRCMCTATAGAGGGGGGTGGSAQRSTILQELCLAYFCKQNETEGSFRLVSCGDHDRNINMYMYMEDYKVT